MSSPFDDIGAPADQPFQKPNYVVRRQKAIRSAILMVAGAPPSMAIATAAYSLIDDRSIEECVWRMIGAITGGAVGAFIGLCAAFFRMMRGTIVRDVLGSSQDSISTGDFRLGAIGGTLLVGSAGAMIGTARENGASVDYLFAALIAGLVYIGCYMLVVWRSSSRAPSVPLAEPVD